MENFKEQIKSIDTKILTLKSIIRDLEEKKQNLYAEHYGSESVILDILPARARNALLDLGINTDLKLKYFINGECEDFINPHSSGLYELRYASVKTPMERLECVRNIGCGTAKKAINILKLHSYFP